MNMKTIHRILDNRARSATAPWRVCATKFSPLNIMRWDESLLLAYAATSEISNDNFILYNNVTVRLYIEQTDLVYPPSPILKYI